MRALLRPLSSPAAHNPIECIVAGFIFATLAYFHVLAAIKQTTFLSPSYSSVLGTLRPAYALLTHAHVLPVDERSWYDNTQTRVELQQLVFTLEANDASSAGSTLLPLSFDDSVAKHALSNVSEHLATAYGAHLSTFTSISPSNAHVATLSLTFDSVGSPSLDFATVLRNAGGTHKGFPLSSDGLHFALEDTQTRTRWGWAAYAFRALILRFAALARAADSLDILLVLAGYVLMHLTFFRLARSSRALGSNFWLTAGILTSSTLAFVLSLPVALLAGVALDPVLLTEALPFLVCTVGFDKPLRLGRAVFTHEHLFRPVAPGSSSGSGTMKPSPVLLLEALDRVGNALLRDYALEIIVLLVGASSKVGGLREICALAAIILTLDCICCMSFLISVMGVMIEVSNFIFTYARFTFFSIPPVKFFLAIPYRKGYPPEL